MKKFLTLLSSVLLLMGAGATYAQTSGVAESEVIINEENFPDWNFCNYLLTQPYGEDGIITPEEIADITKIEVSNKNIKELKGIEHFVNLQLLFCAQNQITRLDVSKCPELIFLTCYENEIQSLDVSNNPALNSIIGYGNKLTTLDLSKCPALKTVSLHHNQLTSLDFSKNKLLTSLYVWDNRIGEEQMQTLVNSLPSPAEGGVFSAIHPGEESEGNVITEAQIKAATDKGWTVKKNDGSDYGPTNFTSTTTELNNGLIYHVTKNTTINDTRIKVNGTATLYLEEGVTLTAKKGIDVVGDATLIIDGPGSLVATADNEAAAIGGTSYANTFGHIVINGGRITATGGMNGAGIGGSKANYVSDNSKITINGGVVKATGGTNAAGIGGGYSDNRGGESGVIAINGGQVTATGGDGGFGIGKSVDAGGSSYSSLTLSWTSADDFVNSSSYNVYCIFAEGKKFLLSGTDTEATVDNMGGKKIVPKTSVDVTPETTVFGDGCIYYVTADVTNDNRIKVVGSAVLHLNEGAKLTATKGIQVEGGNTLTIEGTGRLEAKADVSNAAIGVGTGRNETRVVDYGHIIINGGNIVAEGGATSAGIGGSGPNHNRANNSSITINGGVVSATGGLGAAGIGGGNNPWARTYSYEDCGASGTITINGGKVMAEGGQLDEGSEQRAPGIGKGFNGGGDDLLTLGWTSPTDYIFASSYDVGTIRFNKGKAFVIEGTDTRVTASNIASANGKKLVPTEQGEAIGDVNGDGSVTPADAIMILYYYFGVRQDQFDESAADLNGDGSITPADAIEALYRYFGVGNSARAISPATTDGRDPE